MRACFDIFPRIPMLLRAFCHGRGLAVAGIFMPLAIAFGALTATSCDIHEWPEDAPADLVLKLDFNTGLPQFIVINVGDTRASSDGGAYDVRYIIEAYKKLSDGTVSQTPHKRYVFTKGDTGDLNAEFRLSIDEGTYLFRAWTDFVAKGTDSDLYYNTDNFRQITLQGEHSGNNDFRDAFLGSAELTVRRLGGKDPVPSGTVEMERPLAKFEFVTTDLQSFITKAINEMKTKAGEEVSGTQDKEIGPEDIDLDKYRVVFYYSGYMPYMFNIFDNKPCDSKTGVLFESKIRSINEHEARLGFDYVFVNGKESSVMVTVGLFDEEGTQLSMSRQIEVPIKRSMLTTIKGGFLMQNTGGGVAIDPGFEDEFNVWIQ